MAKKAAITRIRTLYAIFIGVIALCIGLFFFNIINPADPLLTVQTDGHDKDYGVIITDLHSSPELYRQSHDVEGLPEGMEATATVRTFDVDITGDDSQQLASSKANWCMWLQLFCILAGIAMTILIVMALISFYINVRRGKVFPKKNIAWLAWAGVLMIVMSLSIYNMYVKWASFARKLRIAARPTFSFRSMKRQEGNKLTDRLVTIVSSSVEPSSATITSYWMAAACRSGSSCSTNDTQTWL